jgi:hypothetical protein
MTIELPATESRENIMRKVHIEAVIEVPVTVLMKVKLIVQADDKTNLVQAVKSWVMGKTYSHADVERTEAEIVAVDSVDHSDDYTTEEDWLTEASETKLGTSGKLVECEVIDSK